MTNLDIDHVVPATGTWDGYNAVHDKCKEILGPASGYPCCSSDCENPAVAWCFQHTGEILYAEPDHGYPYSNATDDYGPMCHACHMSLDGRMRWADPVSRKNLRGRVAMGDRVYTREAARDLYVKSGMTMTVAEMMEATGMSRSWVEKRRAEARKLQEKASEDYGTVLVPSAEDSGNVSMPSLEGYGNRTGWSETLPAPGGYGAVPMPSSEDYGDRTAHTRRTAPGQARRKLVRYAAWFLPVGIGVVVLAAFTMSAATLFHLAMDVGFSSRTAWLLPAAIDLLSLVALAAWTIGIEAWGRAITIGATVVSLGLNFCGHAIVAGTLETTWWLMAVVSSTPVLAMGLAFHLGLLFLGKFETIYERS